MRQPNGRTSSASSGRTVRKPSERAARTKTPERPLHDYLAEVSEHTEVQSGIRQSRSDRRLRRRLMVDQEIIINEPGFGTFILGREATIIPWVRTLKNASLI
jgi:hypothetical protein